MRQSLDMDEVQATCIALTQQHDLNESVTRKVLKKRIASHIKDTGFYKSPRVTGPECLYCIKTKLEPVDEAVKMQDAQDKQTMYECSKIIRRAILWAHKSNLWKYEGSLRKPNQITFVLTAMLRWTVTTTRLQVDKRKETIDKSV